MLLYCYCAPAAPFPLVYLALIVDVSILLFASVRACVRASLIEWLHCHCLVVVVVALLLLEDVQHQC